jgi:hypothetical protein
MGLHDERNSNDLKIIFICDFYKSDLSNTGGAENNDSVLISLLEKKGYEVVKVYCTNATPKFIESKKGCKFIIGNFMSLSEDAKQSLLDKHYIIYEHDHKYLKTRDPSKFPNFIAPDEEVVNKEFYKNSKCVICLSESQANSVKNNLKIDNVKSIGCSLWSESKLNYIFSISNTKKEKKYCIVDSNNPTKGTSLAVNFCKSKGIDYDLIKSNDEREFLKILSSYETLIFIPTVLESLCRLAVEAKMLNCSLFTKEKLLGASSESWWNLKGEPLIQEIKQKQIKAIEIFLNYL